MNGVLTFDERNEVCPVSPMPLDDASLAAFVDGDFPRIHFALLATE
jgi:hypothetical protein